MRQPPLVSYFVLVLLGGQDAKRHGKPAAVALLEAHGGLLVADPRLKAVKQASSLSSRPVASSKLLMPGIEDLGRICRTQSSVTPVMQMQMVSNSQLRQNLLTRE